MLNVEQIARICHRAVTSYHMLAGSKTVPPLWDALSESRQCYIIDCVTAYREYTTPESMHANWLQGVLLDGWRYGPVYDDEKKESPGVRFYQDLPLALRVEDSIIQAIAERLHRWNREEEAEAQEEAV